MWRKTNRHGHGHGADVCCVSSRRIHVMAVDGVGDGKGERSKDASEQTQTEPWLARNMHQRYRGIAPTAPAPARATRLVGSTTFYTSVTITSTCSANSFVSLILYDDPDETANSSPLRMGGESVRANAPSRFRAHLRVPVRRELITPGRGVVLLLPGRGVVVTQPVPWKRQDAIHGLVRVAPAVPVRPYKTTTTAFGGSPDCPNWMTWSCRSVREYDERVCRRRTRTSR